MLTQAMPALAQALTGVLPDAALRQLMQALGNCQQSLAHRGSTQFSNERQTLPNGLARAGSWNPASYADLLPSAGQNVFVDVPSGGIGGYPGAGNYQYRNGFQFPINSTFNNNQYYGGPTFTVFGDTNLGNLSVQNIYAQTINNIPVARPRPQDSPESGNPDGGPAGGGGANINVNQIGGGGGFGGAGPGLLFTPAVEKKAIVTNIRANNPDITVTKVTKVGYPSKDIAVSLTQWDTPSIDLSVKGSTSVAIPTSAALTKFTGTGAGTVQIPTKAELSGMKLSFSGNVAVPNKLSIAEIAATCTVPVAIPTVGTLSSLTLGSTAVSFNIPTSVTLPTYTGSSNVSIPDTCDVSFNGTPSLPALSATSSPVAFDIPTSITLPQYSGSTSLAIPDKCEVVFDGVPSLPALSATSSVISIAVPTTVDLSEYKYKATCSSFDSILSGKTASGQTVTFNVPVVTGGSLDENCKFVPTTGTQSVTITLPQLTVDFTKGTVTPTVNVTPAFLAPVGLGGVVAQNVTPTITPSYKTAFSLPALKANLSTVTSTLLTLTSDAKAAATLNTVSKSVTPVITPEYKSNFSLPALQAKLSTLTKTSVSITSKADSAATFTTSQQSVTPTINATSIGPVNLTPGVSKDIGGTVKLSSPASVSVDGTESKAVSGTVEVTSYGSIALTTTAQPLEVTLNATDTSITLTTTPTTVEIQSTGTAKYSKLSSASVNPANDELTLTNGTDNITVDVDKSLKVSKDFLIYYRPRF